MFESSQYPAVGVKTFPSPQISVQIEAVEESPRVQVHPVSTAHIELHPFPSVMSPSSQYPAEGLITFPSPHISEQELGVEESPKVHCQPVSTAQLEFHPSPSDALESSQ